MRNTWLVMVFVFLAGVCLGFMLKEDRRPQTEPSVTDTKIILIQYAPDVPFSSKLDRDEWAFYYKSKDGFKSALDASFFMLMERARADRRE